jgi:argininosuccinate lyase
MKLWEKGKKTDLNILAFTVGKDRELDLELAKYDVIGSMAHVVMLESVKLISLSEKDCLINVLLEVYKTITEGNFVIEDCMEDIHSQVEKILTEKLGETGKKIHSARSRNDQVMLDLKLYYREQMVHISMLTSDLINTLLECSEKYKDIIIPGYTHFQAAMPSSFGLWFGAYAESLTEDLMFHVGIMEYINQNPLGSAAGYGSSFPINRELTTELLEFSNLHINSINAQLSRGKTEKFISAGLGAIAGSLGKMSMDMTLFMSQNFGFLKLREELTTGSSIMPHKKNPDVLELIRAKSAKINGAYQEILLLTQNLPSGYHRDFQLLKEILFPAYHELFSCLNMMIYALNNLDISKDIIKDEKYLSIFSVENLNEKVKAGIPFREAYVQVANDIDKGRFTRLSNVNYSHTGSIGNLSNNRIAEKLEKVMEKLEIDKFSGFTDRFINKFNVERDGI